MSNESRSTTFHCPATLPPPVGYSHVVQSTGGTLVHISGQVAGTADGSLVGADDFAAQVEQCFVERFATSSPRSPFTCTSATAATANGKAVHHS